MSNRDLQPSPHHFDSQYRYFAAPHARPACTNYSNTCRQARRCVILYFRCHFSGFLMSGFLRSQAIPNSSRPLVSRFRQIHRPGQSPASSLYLKRQTKRMVVEQSWRGGSLCFAEPKPSAYFRPSRDTHKARELPYWASGPHSTADLHEQIRCVG